MKFPHFDPNSSLMLLRLSGKKKLETRTSFCMIHSGTTTIIDRNSFIQSYNLMFNMFNAGKLSLGI